MSFFLPPPLTIVADIGPFTALVPATAHGSVLRAGVLRGSGDLAAAAALANFAASELWESRQAQ